MIGARATALILLLLAGCASPPDSRPLPPLPDKERHMR